MLGLFFAIFRIFSGFLGCLHSCWFFSSIFLDFYSIFQGLGRVLGGFGVDFSTIFLIILENDDFVKSVVLLRENHSFQGFGL